VGQPVRVEWTEHIIGFSSRGQELKCSGGDELTPLIWSLAPSPERRFREPIAKPAHHQAGFFLYLLCELDRVDSKLPVFINHRRLGCKLQIENKSVFSSLISPGQGKPEGSDEHNSIEDL
jgi:hypothetical protein